MSLSRCERERLHGRRQRRVHGVLAQHLERHALGQVTQAPAVYDQALLRVGQHVDEAGRHRLAVGVDLGAAGDGDVGRDGGDAVAGDGDVGFVGRGAGAVVDEAAPDDDVVGRGRWGGRCGGRHHERQCESRKQADHRRPLIVGVRHAARELVVSTTAPKRGRSKSGFKLSIPQAFGVKPVDQGYVEQAPQMIRRRLPQVPVDGDRRITGPRLEVHVSAVVERRTSGAAEFARSDE